MSDLALPVSHLHQRCREICNDHPFCLSTAKKLKAVTQLSSNFGSHQSTGILPWKDDTDSEIYIREAMAFYMLEKYFHQNRDRVVAVGRLNETHQIGAASLTPTTNFEFATIDLEARLGSSANTQRSYQLVKETLLSRYRNRANLYAFLDTTEWSVRRKNTNLTHEKNGDGGIFERQISSFAGLAIAIRSERKPTDTSLLLNLKAGSFFDRYKIALNYTVTSADLVSQADLANHLKLSTKSRVFLDVWAELKEVGAKIQLRGRPQRTKR